MSEAQQDKIAGGDRYIIGRHTERSDKRGEIHTVCQRRQVNTREILLSFKREDGIFPCASGLLIADAHPDPFEAIDAALAAPLGEDEKAIGSLEWHHLRFAAWVVAGRRGHLPYLRGLR